MGRDYSLLIGYLGKRWDYFSMDVLDYWDKVTYEFLEAILVCDDC